MRDHHYTVQMRTVESVDIDATRTRVYFAPHELTETRDVITFLGMSYAIVPGTKVRITIDIVEEDAA